MQHDKASPGPVQADLSAAHGLGTYGPAQLSSVLLGVRWETQQTWQWEIGPPVQPL